MTLAEITEMNMEKKLIREFLLKTSCQKVELPKEQEPMQKPYAATAQLIKLTEPELLQDYEVNFLEMIELRLTRRAYTQEPITLKELSYLLWATQGVKAVTAQQTTLRTVPSAGARHAFETYLFIQNVVDLKPGLYRFLALEHALLPMGDLPPEHAKAFLSLRTVETSAITLLWAARANRMLQRFGNRGYRYLFIDAGHVCQNLYLAAQTIDVGVCPLGAFDDEMLNHQLALDGVDEFVVYGAALGKI